METADDTVGAADTAADDAAAAGQMETQEQLEEEEVKTDTKTILYFSDD